MTRVILLLAGLGLIGFGSWGYINRYQATHNPNPVIPTETVTVSPDKPDETPPTEACTEYNVPDDQPRKIELPSLDRTGCIQRVGVDQEDRIAVPTNIHLAGWYVNSPLPGEKGVSVIDGHVLGRYNDAIFTDLDKLQTGDTIRIEYGDKSWKSFEVASSDMYSIEKTASEQFKQLDGVESQLTLITCGGNWLPNDETYDQRLVVRTKLVEPKSAKL